MAQNNSTAKVISILDYIGILWILGLFIEKDDPDVKFHTNQGLILFLLEVVTGVFSVLSVIPILGIVFTLAGGLLGIVCLVLAILGIVNAAQGLQKPLPVEAFVGYILIISYTEKNCNIYVIHIHMQNQCIIKADIYYAATGEI